MEVRRTATRSSRIREHLRTNVVGYIAIFLFATGGSAMALQGKNTVDSGDIKNKQVKRADIAPNAVNGSRVANGAIAGADVNESSLAQVPSAADAAAVGGIPGGEIVRTNPALGERARPFLTEGTLNLLVPTDVLDLGFIELRSNDVGGYSVCSQSTSLVHYSFVMDFEPTIASHQIIAPGGQCVQHAAGADVVNFVAEDSTSAVYAILEDVHQDGLVHAWIFN
jgi:hypothetical protein